VVYNKEYYISYKLYTHFLYNKSEYYFIKKKHTYFKKFRLEKLKNKKAL